MKEEAKIQDAEPAVAIALPKQQKKPRSASRSKAKRTFPQFTIEECRKIADAIKQFNAGNPWAPKDIASALKIGMSNNFFYLTAGSRD